MLIWRMLTWAFAVVFAVASAAADDDVSVTLAVKGSRTEFRMGETIPMELRFRSEHPGKYRVPTFSDPHWEGSLDTLSAEPKENTADPHGDMPPCNCGSSGPSQSFRPLGSDALVVDRDANDWISFRKPGRYRIVAETSRANLGPGPPNPVKLRTNAVDIEIVPPEPGWVEKQISDSVAVLGAEPPAPDNELIHAARTLRFLETREAAEAMARFFGQGPERVQWELRVGMFGSPYRPEVIASMEKGLAASDTAITPEWMAMLFELAGGSSQVEKKSAKQHYFGLLADAVGGKTPAARAMCLLTLLTGGPQPPSPRVVKALGENYRWLNNADQQILLLGQWPWLASPDILPLVRSVAEDTQCCARDSALLRWFEMDPQAARPLILERIRTGEVVNAARVMMSLPDKTLPQFDSALADELEKDNTSVAVLIARYATAAILPRVRAWYEAKGNEYGAGLLAYFFRVDPAYAARASAEWRKKNPVAGVGWSETPDLIMTPELEHAAVGELHNEYPFGILTLLQNAASSAAEQPIWEIFENLRNTLPEGSNVGNIEESFVEVLMEASGWLLTPSQIDRLGEICQTQRCRSAVAKGQGKLNEPMRIVLLPEGTMSAMIGPFHLWSLDQVKSKISQFPPGTRFQFDDTYQGTWFAEQRTKAIKELLDAAGMRVL
jgi:hypothetical protein